MTSQRFGGVIGRTYDVSETWWPEPIRAGADAPNVLFLVLDDTGYGHLGCYGGQTDTPNMDKLAANGLLYQNMHTTALCSPTRSCILTGRNHHSNAMAGITEVSTGFPGYNGSIPFENGFLGEMLAEHGYNSFAIGKWHLTPAEQISAAGPFDRWPLGRGFDRYYGFLSGDTHQYYPELTYDNHEVEAPKTPEEGYHLTEDLADRTIRFIGDAKVVAPDKPFFAYFATGAMHAPHHAPPEYIEKYKGKFDMGWDAAREQIFKRQIEMGIIPANTELSQRDPDVAPWDSLSDDERKLYARMMEVFAGFLDHTDVQIGRVIDYLEEIDQLDNTIIMLISDNGSSSEGGPTGSVNENKFFNFIEDDLETNLAAMDDLGGPKYFNHFPWGWTWAGNTPFRRWKRETYRGGISDPFIIHWPAGFKARGEIRTQYCHAIDMVPTILDCIGIDAPDQIRGVTQSAVQGQSLRYTFDDPDAPDAHITQYFEMLGHRSIYHRGWKAVCPWPGTSFVESQPFGTPMTEDDLRRIDNDSWELYNVKDDFAECHNVADEHPDVLRELITLWYVEAGKYDVLPVDGRGQQRFAEERPQLTADRSRFTFFPGFATVPDNAGPKVLNRPHAIEADIEISDDGSDGVLLAHGTGQGGYVLFVKDGLLHYTHNYVGDRELTVSSPSPLPSGRSTVRYEFEPTGEPDILAGKGTPGRGQLYLNGELIAQEEFDVTIPVLLGLGGGIRCGISGGDAVSSEYSAPFEFTGKIHSVTVDVSGELIEDDEATMRHIMARQ